MPSDRVNDVPRPVVLEGVNGELIDRPTDKGPACGCLNRVRAFLREANGVPGTDRMTGAAFVYIRRLDHHGRAPPMLKASFCPICGEPYA